MKFENLTTTSCPDCGCDTIICEAVQPDVRKEKILQHCNGQRWESRTFLCGAKVEWSPNFERVVGIYKCTRTDEYQKREEERSRIHKQIQLLYEQLRNT